jgi:hypothetical protein
MSRFPNRRWSIISADDVVNIDFSQVLESSADSLRYNIAGTETFVKYEGSKPSSIPADAVEYTHSEILALLATEAWTEIIDEE